MHRFRVEDAEKLISKDREKIQPIQPFENFLKSLVLEETAVDVGAGLGYFTVPLAKKFRRVFAVEVDERMAEKLRKRLDDLGIKNVGIVISEEPPDFDFEIDLVLFANVLHEIENWKDYLYWSSKAKCVAVIDWKKEPMKFGPPLEERLDEKEVEGVLKRFFSVKKLEVYDYHYFLVGYKED